VSALNALKPVEFRYGDDVLRVVIGSG
jgi:hypothetical protein